MSTVVKPNTFTPNTTISSSEINDNFDTIYNEFNGNISATNLATNAITTAKITDSNVTTAKLADGAITTAKLDSSVVQGYYDLGDVPDTVTYNGNRSYDLVFNSNDLTDTASNGMRVKLARTVTPPTQCTDLESGSSQYWSKTSPAGTTFTDDFCAGAWIKLESYGGASTPIISRYNGTSGWQFTIATDGTILLQGNNASSANYSRVQSYQSVPLNKWVHIAAQLDMSAFTATSTTSYIMIDGVNVPAAVSRAGTNPTALVQAGNLEIGSANGGTGPFDGKIAQAWYSSAKITQDTIKTFISQGMTGAETSIVSHFDFNGDANDNNANANNLTANGGAGYATDSPFNATEYGIITANSFSTNTTLTVQVPEGYAIPTSGGVSSVFYSTQHVPYGFPADKGKWRLNSLLKTNNTTTSNANYGSLISNGFALTVPIGAFGIGYNALLTNATTTSVYFCISPTSLSGIALGSEDTRYTSRVISPSAATSAQNVYIKNDETLSASQTWVMYTHGATTGANIGGALCLTEIFAELAYI